jgi:tetratricopeptide (TPR) repeat protein
MKHLLLYLAMIVSLISLLSYSQNTKNSRIHKKSETAQKVSDTLIEIGAINIRTINSYFVEEKINQKFGGYSTTYEVSKANMIYTYDLGPNNTRIITPVYGEEKQIHIKNLKLNKNFLKPTNLAELALLNKNKRIPIQSTSTIPCYAEAEEEIMAKNNAINTTVKSEKFIYIHLIQTYERVAEKGCKSIEIFQKLGDAYFFEGNYVKAVKWYGELFAMTTDLESEYYERYAYSLRALGYKEKANETIKKRTNTKQIK